MYIIRYVTDDWVAITVYPPLYKEAMYKLRLRWHWIATNRFLIETGLESSYVLVRLYAQKNSGY